MDLQARATDLSVASLTGQIACAFDDGFVAFVSIDKQEVRYVGRLLYDQSGRWRNCVAITADGKTVAGVGQKELRLWRGKGCRTIELPFIADQLLFSPDDTALLIRGLDRRILVFDLGTSAVRTFVELAEIPLLLRFAKNDNALLAICERNIIVVPFPRNAKQRELKEIIGRYGEAGFFDDGMRVFLADKQGHIVARRLAGQETSSLDLKSPVISSAVSLSGRNIVVGLMTGQVVCISTSDGILRKEWFVLTDGGLPSQLAFSGNGKRLVVRTGDRLLEFDFERIKESGWRNF